MEMEEDRLKRDAKGKASALLSCSGSESEGEEVKSQFYCKTDEITMEENPEPEDLEEEDDSEEEDESDDDDEETDDDDDDAAKSACDKVDLLDEESSDQGEGDDCPICLNRLKYQDIGTPESCDHSFCLDCIQLWARNVNTCPVDRREFELILARHAGEDEIFKKIPVAEKSFEAEEDTGETENDLTYCEVCGQSNREDRLLLCDGCDLGFHCECLDPPLDSVPVEEWFCPDCAEANTHRRIINDHEDDTQYLLEENSPSEALPYLRPRRRQIARTRISERVRARIQEYREGLARLVCDDKESGAFGRGSTSTELSRTRSQTRQSEANKKQSTRRKSKRLATGKKKVLSRRKQQRRAKTLKKNQILDRFCNTTKSPKSRLAGKLGLTKSRSFLRKSERTTAQQVVKENLYGIKPLSIMGHKHELDQFDEDDSFGRSSEPQASTSMLSSASSKRSSKYSASALLSRQPVARPLLCKLPDDKTNSSLFSCQSSSSGASNSSSGGARLDLLGTIMMEQSILHMKSKDIKINRDGSLTAKKLVSVSAEECQSKSSQLQFDNSAIKEDENSKLQADNDSEKNPESPEEENSLTSVTSSQTKNNHRLEKIHNSSSESKEERSPVVSGESEPETKTPEEEEEEEEEAMVDDDDDETECSETVDENFACVNEEEEREEEEEKEGEEEEREGEEEEREGEEEEREGEEEEREGEEEEEEMDDEDECKGDVSDDTKTTANKKNKKKNKSAGDESEEETEDSSQDGVLDAATMSNNSEAEEDIKSVSPNTEVNSQLYNSDDSCATENNNNNNKESTEPELENSYDPILEEKTLSVGFSPELDLEQQSEAEDTAPVKEGESSCEDVSSVNVDTDGNKAESETIAEQQQQEQQDDVVSEEAEESDEENCPEKDDLVKSDKEDDTKQADDTSDIEVNVKSAEEYVDEDECKSDTEDDSGQKESAADELESADNCKETSTDVAADEQASKEQSPLDNFEKSESAKEEESDENIESGAAGENLTSDEQTNKKFEIIEEMSDNFDETSTNLVDLEKVYQENSEETNEIVEKEVSASESEASSVAEGEREGDKPKIPISELPRIPKRNRRDLYKREKSSRSDGPELKSVLGRVDMSDYKMKRGWGKKDRKSRWDPDDWNQSERDFDFISSRDRKSDGNKNYHSDRSESSHESEKYGFEYKESRSRKKRHDISRSHSKSHKDSSNDYRDIPHCRYSPEKSKTRKRERSRNHSRSCSRDKIFDYDKSSKRKSRGRSRDKSPSRKSKRHRSYSRSPSRKSHKDRGLSDKRRHRDDRKRIEDRVHKRYSDRSDYEEKKNRHNTEEFEDWDDGSCQVILDYPVEQNESPSTKPEKNKKSSDRFYKSSPNDKVSETYFEKRSSQERSAFKGNKLDETGHFYNARPASKKQKFVDRFYKAPHLRDAGTEKFPIHLSEDEGEVEPTPSKPEPEEVQKNNDHHQGKENELDSGNSEYDPAFPTESGSPLRHHDQPAKLVETAEEESAPVLSESEGSSAPCTVIEETAPACTQAVATGDPTFILHDNPNVQNLPVQSQNISFPMGLRMMPPNMQPGMPQHLLMNPMFLSRPPPFGRLPRMAGPVNRMGWPMNPSGMMQLPPNRFGPGRMGPGGGMPPRPGLLNGGFENMSQEHGQSMTSFKQHPCDPRHLPSQTHSPGQISRTGLPTAPGMSHIPPPGSLLGQQHPPPPPPTSQMHMPPPSTSNATSSLSSLELDESQTQGSVHLHQQQTLGSMGINKTQPSSEKSLPPNFIVPEMNQITKLLEAQAQAQAQAQLAMLAEEGNDGKQRKKQLPSQNSDIDVFKIPLPPMAPPSMPPPSLGLQLMPPPDSFSFSTNTTSTTNNSATTNTFSNSSSNNISSSNNTNVKVYKSHQSKLLSNSHRSSEPVAESTEVVDMDVASPLDDDVEIELPASPELDDIDDSKLSSKDSSVIELSVAEDMPASAVELSNLTNKEKHASRLAKGNRKTCQQRTLSPTSTKVSYMGYMKKLQIQERVVDEVKLAIKPFYSGKKIDKNEYKEILRKAVPKICHSKSGNINPAKIKALIEAYVDKLCKTRRCLERRKKGGVKANGERVKKPSR